MFEASVVLHPCNPPNFSTSLSVIEATSLTDSTDNLLTKSLALLRPTPLIPTNGIMSGLQPCCNLVLVSLRISNNGGATVASLRDSCSESIIS